MSHLGKIAIVQKAAVVTLFCQTQFGIMFNYFWLLRNPQKNSLGAAPF
jgi:hypothetical protein